MKNIRTILLLSATCLTIIGTETSFASLNGASLLDYTGASATSTSICNNIIPYQVVHLHQVHQVQVVVILMTRGVLTIPNVAIWKAI